MKDIDKKDVADVAGGYTPGDKGCIPGLDGLITDYPSNPLGPIPDVPDPSGDGARNSAK